jgi:predicted RNase H-like nuclease
VTDGPASRVVGVDGIRRGWLAVALENGRFAGARPFATLRDICDAHADAAAIAVDIPIGLPSPASWPRRADAAAKEFLRAHASRVFLTFPRAVYEAPTHAAAVVLAKELGCTGISQQSFALRHKILEAEALDDERVIEVHPELAFAELAGRVLPTKHSWRGLRARMDALERAGIDVPAEIEAGGEPAADVLDAAVAAWTAARCAAHRAVPLSDEGGGAVIWR